MRLGAGANPSFQSVCLQTIHKVPNPIAVQLPLAPSSQMFPIALTLALGVVNMHMYSTSDCSGTHEVAFSSHDNDFKGWGFCVEAEDATQPARSLKCEATGIRWRNHALEAKDCSANTDATCDPFMTSVSDWPTDCHFSFPFDECTLFKNTTICVTTDGTTFCSQPVLFYMKATGSSCCPAGCVSANARQRRQLLFGSTPSRAECPEGCVRA